MIHTNADDAQVSENQFKKEIVNRLTKKYEKTKSKILESDIFTRKVRKTLYNTNRKLMVIQRRRNKLNSELQHTNHKIEDLNKKIKTLTVNISSKKTKISRQIRALYKLSSQNALFYVLKSKSFNELERNKKFLKIISESDYDAIISYANDLKELKEAKEDLKKGIEKSDILVADLEEQNKELRKEVRSKRVLLSHLKKQKNKYLKKLSNIKNTTQKLAISDKIDDLNALFGTDFFEQKGYLKLPVNGMITSRFGVFKDPVYKNKIKKNGLFISSVRESAVRNVHPGRVSFVGDMRGLGKVIIVSHGDHYYTVYGNNKEVFVNEGDKLNIHHKIGTIAKSPIYQKYGSYFEIRYFSEPINPTSWVDLNKDMSQL